MPTSSAILNREDDDDVQGLTVSPYGGLDWAAFWLLRIRKESRPWEWLAELDLTMGTTSRSRLQSATNVAFSFHGLRGFGLGGQALDEFSAPFREGMAGALDPAGKRARNRSWALGDVEDSDPENWEWGNAENPVDVVVLVYSSDRDGLVALVKKQRDLAKKHGLEFVFDAALATEWPRADGDDRKREHFGFVEGMSQPTFAAAESAEPNFDDTVARPIALGELLLGHPDEAGRLARGPTVERDAAAVEAGLSRISGRNRCDFGRNGTYLVFRQLEQDVLAFWDFARQHEKLVGLDLEMCAAKMMGRWPNGAPLTLAPHEAVLPPGVEVRDEFLYLAHGDGAGASCPLGSHIRRVNPRDTLPGFEPRASLEEVRRHRILRRGRPYGKKVDGWPDPRRMLENRDGARGARPGDKRGIHFLCLNADIARQFEHVQQQWVSNPNFVSRPNEEVDPIIGGPSPNSRFLIPRKPAPVLLGEHGVPCRSFVTVRGGGYFFLPSRSALRYLAAIAPAGRP